MVTEGSFLSCKVFFCLEYLSRFFFKDLKGDKNEEVQEPQSNTRNSPVKSKKPSSFGTKKTTLSSTVGNREDSVTSDTVTDVKSPGTKRKPFQKRPSNKSQSSDSESKTLSQEQTNVSMNKRVLDPKRGPIKKTAATRHLPKIDRWVSILSGFKLTLDRVTMPPSLRQNDNSPGPGWPYPLPSPLDKVPYPPSPN